MDLFSDLPAPSEDSRKTSPKGDDSDHLPTSKRKSDSEECSAAPKKQNWWYFVTGVRVESWTLGPDPDGLPDLTVPEIFPLANDLNAPHVSVTPAVLDAPAHRHQYQAVSCLLVPPPREGISHTDKGVVITSKALTLPLRLSQESKWRCLQGFVAERQGERDEMQDAHVIIDDLTPEVADRPSSIERLAYYAVFDGHSGSRAAHHAAKHLHQNIKKHLPNTKKETWEKDMKRCFIEAFKKTDEAFLKEASAQKPAWKDGSTAVCVLVVNDTLYIANVGDSRAMICRYNTEEKKHHLIPLSKEHNPTQYEERMRIQKAGGFVRDGRLMGILEVSRSIGDGRFKHCGVICQPDVKKCQLTDNDRFILLSCDGLWTDFDPASAAEFVQKLLEEDDSKVTDGKSSSSEKYDIACNKLASEAVRRGSSDNVTVILVKIS